MAASRDLAAACRAVKGGTGTWRPFERHVSATFFCYAARLVFALLFIPWFKLEGFNIIPGTEIGIQPFGILVAIGVLAGMRLSEWRGERIGLRREVVSDFATHVVIIGFIFGHMFDMVF